MHKARRPRPSPALVISIVALFVALGGSAYAVNMVGTKQIRKNAVTTAKIKRNAVTTAKIRNGAVTGAKIRNGAVTGTKIREGTLSAVPIAGSATNAVNFSRYSTSGLVRAAEGQSPVLLTIGPFTFTGKCDSGGAGKTRARTFLTTTQPNSNAYAFEGGFWQGNFNPGTELEVGLASNDAGTYVGFFGPATGFFTAVSADGSVALEGTANNAVNAFGADCAFLASAMQGS